MSEKKGPLSKELLELSAKLKSKMSVDDEGVLLVDANAHDDVVPSEIKEHVAPVQAFESLFNTALLHAAGEVALPVIKEKGHKRISGSVPAGNNTTSVNITTPSGRNSDGTMKDPVVTVISRRREHEDYGTVRQGIYDAYRALSD